MFLVAYFVAAVLVPYVFAETTAFLLLFLAWGVWSEVQRRKYRNEIASYTDPGRVMCFGNDEELDALKGQEGAFFESFVMHSSWFEQKESPMRRPVRDNLPLLVAVVGCFILLRWMGFSMAWVYGFYSFMYLAARFVMLHAFPIYYRVRPGSLEILTGPTFSASLFLRRQILLKTSEIVCRFDRGYIAVRPTGEAEERIYLSREVEDREFARKVLLAAVSPYSSPELPGDTLLG